MMESVDVPQDVEVARQVVHDHRVTIKRLAMECRRDQSSVYRFMAGEKTMPSDVLRSLFEITNDFRLLGLITGKIAMTFHSIPPESEAGCPNARQVRIPPIDELLPMACKANELCARAIPFMGDILKDGKIGPSDLQAINNFDRHWSEANRCNGLVSASLQIARRKAGV